MKSILTSNQKRALAILERDGRVFNWSTGSWSGARDGNSAHRSTLDSLVKRGLAEWSDDPNRHWTTVVKPGGNAARRVAELAARDAKAAARQARIDALAADPVALATALVDALEAQGK